MALALGLNNLQYFGKKYCMQLNRGLVNGRKRSLGNPHFLFLNNNKLVASIGR